VSRPVVTLAERHVEADSELRALSLDELPDLLTVAEAAAYLSVGRNTAYALCRQWRLSGGREGLGYINVGRGMRVPKSAMQRFVATCHGSYPASGLSVATSPHNGGAALRGR
jgi:excisionase family DNA binding protein